MKVLYKGKTKDVYELDKNTVLLKFKDDMTGADGKFDPGANQVGLSIEGSGLAGLKLSKYFFERFKEEGIESHYISSDLEEKTMTVKKASSFGSGLEVICRYRAVGSFIRRYGLYIKEGQKLDAFIEFTLKDDGRNDPPICKDGLVMLGILKEDEYYKIKEDTRKISDIIRDELASFDIELYDLKLEFGRVDDGNLIALIDEVSGGNMRAFKGGKGLDPMELSRLVTGDEIWNS